MREEEDGRVRQILHQIGADLSAVSVDELDERIGLLRSEIERLESEKARKLASRDAAAAFFR